MSNSKNILDEIGNREDEIVKLCRQLIGFKSVNPPGDVSDIAGFIKDYLLGRGFKVETVSAQKDRINVIASLQGGGKRTLVWNGHMDVVPPGKPENWKSDPYDGTERSSTLVGRGAADMKGSIASALEAASIIVEKEAELEGTLTFHLVPDEETMGKYGTGFLVEKGYYSDVDACIVGEGSCSQTWGPALCLAEKGVLTLRIKAAGRSAHASMPFLGENAIDKLIKVIPKVEALSQETVRIDPKLIDLFNRGKAFYSIIFNKMLGLSLEQIERLYTRLTFNLGMIKGGIKSNVVPDDAAVEIDVRVPPLSDLKETLSQIDRTVKESGIKGITIEQLEDVEPSYQDPTAPIVELARKCMSQVWGREPALMIIPGATDARFIRNKLGVPTIVLGPTSETAHAANEYVMKKDLTLCSKTYALIALEFLS